MSAEYVFDFQVIPSILGQPANGDEKQSQVFAYVSVEDTEVQENKPKALCGQIRKCNLTKSRLAGGLILGEVLSFVTLYYIILFFLCILFLFTLYDCSFHPMILVFLCCIS